MQKVATNTEKTKMKITTNYLRQLIKEELDRHQEGENLLRRFQRENPGAKPSEKELRRLAKRMDLHDDAVSDAMGLDGYGNVHSDS